MKWNIDDTPIFIAVVEQKGISAAALQLNISKSTVSKVITRLEEALGVRLIERNSRNVRVTSEGQAFFQQCLQIQEQVNQANDVMTSLVSQPKGKLVVALPIAFSREFVAHHLEVFRQKYPDVELEIIVTSQHIDIIRDQIDLAVVIGSLSDSELIVKTLYESKLLWVTSPDFVRDNTLGHSVDELRKSVRICEKRYASNKLSVRDNSLPNKEQKDSLDLSRKMYHVNDPLVVREAVIHGCGVSLLAEQHCKKYFESGKLIQVFQHIEPDASAAKLSAIYPSRRLISNKTRAFLDFLTSICADI